MKSNTSPDNPTWEHWDIAPDLRSVCEIVADGILVVDLDTGKVVYFNEAACSMFGRSASELSSVDFRSLIADSESTDANDLMMKMGEAGNAHSRNIKLRASDGRIFEAALTSVHLGGTDRRLVALMLRPLLSMTNAAERSQILASIAMQSTEGVALVDLDGNIQFVNRAFAEMHGYSTDELLGKHLSIFHTPEQMTEVSAANKEIAEKGEFTGEIWHLRRDGTEFPATMHNSLLRDESGTPIGMIGTLRDISERKEAERELRESEARYRAILSAVPDLMFQFDSEGTFLSYIAPKEELYMDESQFLGKKAHDVLPRNVADLTMMSIEAALESGGVQSHEYELPIAGRLRRFECRMIATDPDKVLAIIRDITERQQARAALEESEQRYRKLTEVAFGGIVISRDAKIEKVSERFAELFGYSVSELIGKDLAQLIEPGYVDEALDKIVSDYEAPYESVCMRKDGSTFPVEVCGRIVNYHGKKARIAAVRDITTRSNALQALTESENRYRTLYETMAQGVIYQNESGIIISANPAAERILGFSKEELLGRTFGDLNWKFIRPDGSELSTEEHPAIRALQTGTVVEQEVMGVFNPVLNDWVWINYNSVPQFLNNEKTPHQVYSTFTDISLRKRAEDALKKSQLELEARHKALESIADVTDSLHRSLEYQTVVESAVDAMIRYSQSPSVGMFSVNREANLLELLHASGFTEATVVAAETMPLDNSLTGRAVMQNQIMVSEDLTTDERIYVGVRQHLADQGFVTIVSVPISHQDEVNGAMVLIFREPRPLDQRERDTLMSIGRSIGLAMSNAEHVAQVTQEIAERKRAEFEVLKERDRAQNYLDIAGVMIVALDRDARVTLINRRGCEILGYSEKEILNKNWFDHFVPANNKKELMSVFHELMAGHIDLTEYHENPILNKFGEERIIAWHNALLADESEKVVATLSSGEDITERKRADEALRKAYDQLTQDRKSLVAKNIALREVLEHIDDERKQVRAKIAETVDRVLTPAVNRLVNRDGTVNQSFFDLLKNSLHDLASTSDEILYLYSKLSPREAEICNLIRNGATSQEIADALYISLGTVKKHREKIRKKLKLANKSINLSAFLKGLKGV